MMKNVCPSQATHHENGVMRNESDVRRVSIDNRYIDEQKGGFRFFKPGHKGGYPGPPAPEEMRDRVFFKALGLSDAEADDKDAHFDVDPYTGS